MHPYIKYIIGDGPDTFLWLDNWHPVWPILKAKGEKAMYAAALGSILELVILLLGIGGDGLVQSHLN